MDIGGLFQSLTSIGIVNAFFKVFAIVFSFFYLVYALVLVRQTRVLNKALEVSSGGVIFAISFFHILLGILLILLSIVLL